MRPLTPEEQALLKKCQTTAGALVDRRKELLTEFYGNLNVEDIQQALDHPAVVLPMVCTWAAKAVDPTREDWDEWGAELAWHLGLIVGEILVKRFEGEWYLGETPDTEIFGKHIVGRFRDIPKLYFLPFPFIDDYIREIEKCAPIEYADVGAPVYLGKGGVQVRSLMPRILKIVRKIKEYQKQ